LQNIVAGVFLGTKTQKNSFYRVTYMNRLAKKGSTRAMLRTDVPAKHVLVAPG